jgi:hypothetical protein
MGNTNGPKAIVQQAAAQIGNQDILLSVQLYKDTFEEKCHIMIRQFPIKVQAEDVR